MKKHIKTGIFIILTIIIVLSIPMLIKAFDKDYNEKDVTEIFNNNKECFEKVFAYFNSIDGDCYADNPSSIKMEKQVIKIDTTPINKEMNYIYNKLNIKYVDKDDMEIRFYIKKGEYDQGIVYRKKSDFKNTGITQYRLIGGNWYYFFLGYI